MAQDENFFLSHMKSFYLFAHLRETVSDLSVTEKDLLGMSLTSSYNSEYSVRFSVQVADLMKCCHPLREC
jgi:hypothetical protein